ncbi:MAG: RHS repeat-associated core domain-containing protein, partial [Planctomycetaceae bacterium]|nr:RHS repeat-associated core domain-containing protein [Planctomycetaceae bacterium]
TIFVHDDWQVILTFDSAKNKFYGYFWGTRQDELLCYEDYENYIDNWTLGDHLNTIRDVVKSDGTVAAHLEYNAFGKLISDIKNDLLLFGYTGKLFDKSSDLQWNINRWYDSNAGRWVSEDPIAIDGGDSNLYRYADNSVIDVIDSWGYFSITSFTFPGNFEVNIPFIYGTEIVITLDITATDNNCCLSYQLAGGVVLSIRDRVLGLIGRAIPQRIKNYLANRLPDISANIMLMGDLGKLDNPYTNRNKCSCVKCKSTCLLGITGGVGIGDTSRGGGKGSEREDGSTKRRVLAIGASGSVQGTYDYCSGDRQFSITAFISVGINFGFYAYNRNFTGTIWKYP